VALVFGVIVAATDPISVLSISRTCLLTSGSPLLSKESLFNDEHRSYCSDPRWAVASSRLDVLAGLRDFAVEVAAARLWDLDWAMCSAGSRRESTIQRLRSRSQPFWRTVLTFLRSRCTCQASSPQWRRLDDWQLRNAYRDELAHTDCAVSFWEYASFLINSVLFLLIGLQVRLGELLHMWRAAVLSIAAVLVARLLTVYGLVPSAISSPPRFPYDGSMSWCGRHEGALSLALVLSIGNSFPYRDQLLNLTLE